MSSPFFKCSERCAKGFTDGTHRARPPAETLRAWRPMLPRFGITRLANVTGLDVIGLPVYVAVRPNSRALATSQGKGLDPVAAKVSAMMESIEAWHGERVELPLRCESYAELSRRVRVVEVDRLALRTGAVLRKDVPLVWAKAWDLMQEGEVWLPLETVSTNFVRAGRTNPTMFYESTNGLASGNHLLEATVHGLCEVIERDALSLFFLEDAGVSKARQIDLASVHDDGCRRILALIQRAGVHAAVWDITTDLGIPAYAATIIEEGDRPRWRAMGAFSGYGCHLSPAVALMRALSEAVQSRLTMISGSRDDLLPRDYVACSNLDDQRRMLDGFRAPAPTLAFASREDRSTAGFETDLAVLLEALRAAGVGCAAIADLSQPDVGIPVVKVVVPGLEGLALSGNYQPGRRAIARRAQLEAAR